MSAFDAALPVALGKAVRSQAKRVLITGYLFVVVVVVNGMGQKKICDMQATCFESIWTVWGTEELYLLEDALLLSMCFSLPVSPLSLTLFSLALFSLSLSRTHL